MDEEDFQGLDYGHAGEVFLYRSMGTLPDIVGFHGDWFYVQEAGGVVTPTQPIYQWRVN